MGASVHTPSTTVRLLAIGATVVFDGCNAVAVAVAIIIFQSMFVLLAADRTVGNPMSLLHASSARPIEEDILSTSNIQVIAMCMRLVAIPKLLTLHQYPA